MVDSVLWESCVLAVALPPRIEALLKSIYYDASHWASFGSAAELLAAARLHRRNITHAQVERWLQVQNAYTLHRKIIRKFPHRKFLSKGLHHMRQADLVDMQVIQKENAGRRYLLTAIDVFSRQAFAKAIRTKKSRRGNYCICIDFMRGWGQTQIFTHQSWYRVY